MYLQKMSGIGVFNFQVCPSQKGGEKIQIWCYIAVATHRSKGASDLRDVAWWEIRLRRRRGIETMKMEPYVELVINNHAS